MLTHPTHERLIALGLAGMAKGFEGLGHCLIGANFRHEHGFLLRQIGSIGVDTVLAGGGLNRVHFETRSPAASG